jgi:hydrogenase maturation protein HypF
MTTMTGPSSNERTRCALRVRGTVQGVGFRPFVHRLAERHALAGFVCNDDDGVLIEVEGPPAVVEAFVATLGREAPPAARVESLEVVDRPVQQATGFRIAPSPPRRVGTVPVSPDLATCAECWREFRDPNDRRHRYPFLNCTQCGPRYTIVLDVPYDRERTTMAGFTLCADCRREFATEGDRRFHAQPLACPACGPTLRWVTADDAPGTVPIEGEAALAAARRALAAGQVLAVKGLGGVHLVCDATEEAVVARLRARKQRPHQPLAVLVADLSVARALARVSDEAAALLESPAAPIVLLPARAGGVAPNVAPGVDVIGLMLPYSPLHALLAEHGPLVCTSGNLSGEPITWRDADARERLAPLVDGWLTHDRPIAVPCDDSVLQADDLAPPAPVRRSRGYAPMPIALDRAGASASKRPAVLAVGAELKATLAVTRGDQAFLSGHLGDVGDPLTLEAMARHAEHLLGLYHVAPDRVACDAHPGYLSARWARTVADARGVPLIAVQHHHAHLAALQAEHGRPDAERVLAVTFDGTGYGPDGTIWGGEFLVGNCHGARRAARLRPFPLPGGDAAVRQPARVALALLHALALPWTETLAPVRHFRGAERQVLRTQLARALGTVATSSMGRLFDACAALIGGRQTVTYEGQAAIECSALAIRGARARPMARYRCAVRAVDGRLELDPLPMLVALMDDVTCGVAPETMAWGMHDAIASAVVLICRDIIDGDAAMPVGLTGGVFQNRLLLALCRERLEAVGLSVRVHTRVPCNDGGLALGQAVIARASDRQHPPCVIP